MANLADTYARALLDSEKSGLANGSVKNFISAIKRRGHERLLPQVIVKYERFKSREVKNGVRVRIASECDRVAAEVAATKEASVTNADISIDQSLVSGFSVDGFDFRIDKNGRRALLELYNKITS